MSGDTELTEMTGGEAMLRAALANGTAVVFGLPGAQTYPLFDAMARIRTPLIVPRHEQSAGYMAMGYAKSTGRVGVMSVVPGPGVLNASAALCTAMGNCSPVVCLTGQVPSEYLGRGRGQLHELPDQQATLKTIIKDALHAATPTDAPGAVNRAFAAARAGRPGPVSVEMCWDSMAERARVAIQEPMPAPLPPEPDPDAVERAVSLLAGARRPMIMCGAGAQHASAAVTALAELLGAPVTAFRSGRGVLAEDHALAAPPVAARLLWDEVDVLLGIGSRLEMPYIRWRDPMRYEPRPAGPTLIRIDINPLEMSRLVPDVGIVADADVACRRLVDLLGTRLGRREDRRDDIASARHRARALLESRLQPQTAFLDALRRVIPRNGFLVPELSQLGFATYTGAYPVLAPRTYVTEGHQGTLGFGFPTALGVKVANPDRAVVSISGDGGFMFGVAELATAVQHAIAVVAVVFNNGAYGNVLRDQREQYEGRIAGARLRNPDFTALAESCGVAGSRVSTPAGFARALEHALASDASHLIEVTLESTAEASAWPLIHMRTPPA